MNFYPNNYSILSGNLNGLPSVLMIIGYCKVDVNNILTFWT